MLEEAYRPVTVSEDGNEITLPMAQAVFRSLAAAAAKGEAKKELANRPRTNHRSSRL